MSNDIITIQNVKSELTRTKDMFEKLKVGDFNFEKELEWAMQAFQKNPSLLKCQAETVRNCLVNIALTGLTLNPVMKEAYLVPRDGKCCIDPSYMGMQKILTDTNSVVSVTARPVYENEPFEIEKGSRGYVKHSICRTGHPGKRIGAYSKAVLHDGSEHIEWMYEHQLMNIKSRSKGGTAWSQNEDEMCRKTVVKRHWKYLPKSEKAEQVAQVIAMDNEANGIDFEKERKVEEKKNMSIDIMHPDEVENQNSFNSLKELMSDGTVPNVFKAANNSEVNIVTTMESLEKEFVEGTLHTEKFEKWSKYFRQIHAHFLKSNKDGNV